MLPMQKARYMARACGAASFAQSKNGNMQCAVPFEITQGDFAGEQITWIGTMHDTADRNGQTGTERVIASLQYMGWQGDDISELADVTDEQAQAMLPDEVSLQCEPEVHEGKERLKVQWVNRPGGRFAFKEPTSGNELKSFAAQLKSTVKATRAREQGGAPRQAKPAYSARGGVSGGGHPNAPGSDFGGGFGAKRDDDIPFATCSMSSDPSPIAKALR